MEQNTQGQMTKIEENKEQNKKAFGKFAVIMLCSVLLGGVIGFFFCAMLDHYDVTATSEMLGSAVTVGLGCGMPVVMSVLWVVAVSYVLWAIKRTRREWNDARNLEDEAFDSWYEKADGRLENALELTSYLTIINYFGFSASFYAMLYHKDRTPYGLFLLSLAVLIITIISSIMLQSRIVDMVKIINPEKSGSVYDMKFQDKWIESCDEFEQLMIYKAAFKAYKVTNFVCTMLWMVFTILALVIKLSLWPVAIVSFFWFLMTVTYTTECKKLAKGKNVKVGAAGNTVSI